MSKMVISILRMPADLFWAGDPVSRQAHESIRQLAADRIEYLEAQVEACSARNSSDVDRIADLEEALTEAITLVQDWGAYVDEYFQQKHDLAGDAARLRAVLTQEEGG